MPDALLGNGWVDYDGDAGAAGTYYGPGSILAGISQQLYDRLDVAGYLAAGPAPGPLPAGLAPVTVAGGAVQWQDVATQAELEAFTAGPVLSVAPIDAAFCDVFGPTLALFDSFDRADRTLAWGATEGENAPTGQRYTSDGAIASDSHALITGQQLDWEDWTPGGVPIRILGAQLNRTVQAVGGVAVFEEGTGGSSQNAVIGVAQVSFAQGSVQLFLAADGSWSLFVVEHPIVDPYPVLAAGAAVPGGLATDGTAYPFYLERDPTDPQSVLVRIPALGVAQVVTDPLIAQYWGSRVCWQARRPNAADGRVLFDKIGASTLEPHASGVAASLQLPYLQGTYLACTPPKGYAPTNPKVTAWAAPSGGWTGLAAAQALYAWWGTTAGADHRSFAAAVQANGKPSAYLSVDGVATIGPITCATALPAAAKGLTIEYDRVTGNVLFHYTTDDRDTAVPVWTELGAAGGVNAVPGGGLLYAPPRRTPMQAGTRANAGTLMYGGALSRVVLSDNGVTIADCDLRTIWLASRRLDPQGNLWYLLGAGWSWQLEQKAISGLAATLATVALNAAQQMAPGQAAITAAGETVFYTPAVIPPEKLTAGAVFRLRVSGKLSLPNGAGSPATMRLKVGGVTHTSVGTSAPTATYVDKLMAMDLWVWVDAVGAGGAVSVGGGSDSLTVAGANNRQLVSTEAVAKDLSAGLALSLAINLPAVAGQVGVSFTPLRVLLHQVK